MLAVKRVFALNDAAVIGFPARLRFGNERGKHRIIRDSRIFQGQILPAGSLMADGAGCNDQILGPNGRVEAAAVPTRRNVCTPMAASSSIQMAALGPPMPVEVTQTGMPSSVPVNVRNSR